MTLEGRRRVSKGAGKQGQDQGGAGWAGEEVDGGEGARRREVSRA